MVPILRILLEGFAERGWKSTAVIERNIVERTDDAVLAGAGGGGLRMLLDFLNPVNWFRMLNAVRRRPDCAIFVAPHSLVIPYLLWARLVGVPCISVIHDPVPHSGRWYRFAFYVVHWFQARMSAQLVTTGESLRQDIERTYGVSAQEIIVVPLCTLVNAPTEVPPLEARHYVSFLGRLEPYKGLDILLDAIALVRGSPGSDSVKFFVGGAGSQEKFVQQYGPPLGIESDLRLLSDTEFANYARRSRVVVLPYRDATQSSVIPTCYAFGTPVIATRVGGLPEVVDAGKTGLLCEPTAESLADALSQVISGKFPNQVTLQECRALFERRFLPSAFQAQYAEIVNTVLEKNR